MYSTFRLQLPMFPTTVRNIGTNSNCVINEIYQREENAHCTLQQHQSNSTIWKQLYMPNTWMFISTKPFKVGITCRGQRQDVALNNSGIIQINENCIIKTKHNILTPKRNDGLSILGSYNRPVNIDDNTMISATTFHHIPEEAVLRASDDLAKSKQAENSINEELQNTTWHHVKSHSMITSTLTTVGIIAIACVIYCIIKNWLQRRKNRTQNQATRQPVPHPRQFTKQSHEEPGESIPLTVVEAASTDQFTLQPIYSEVHQT